MVITHSGLSQIIANAFDLRQPRTDAKRTDAKRPSSKKNEGTKPADAAETTITTVKAGSPIAAVAARDGGRASVTASKCLVMASNQLRASVVLDGHRRPLAQ